MDWNDGLGIYIGRSLGWFVVRFKSDHLSLIEMSEQRDELSSQLRVSQAPKLGIIKRARFELAHANLLESPSPQNTRGTSITDRRICRAGKSQHAILAADPDKKTNRDHTAPLR